MKFFRIASRIVLALILLFIAYQIWIFAHVWWWRDHNPDDTAFMDEQRDVLQQKDPKAELKHQWVPYNRIS
ncbi:MAG: hypothetical protein JO218_16355, partial [Burkholderiales bacterium]|nr:hypothetical protein [Burkholderiales bacterium]